MLQRTQACGRFGQARRPPVRPASRVRGRGGREADVDAADRPVARPRAPRGGSACDPRAASPGSPSPAPRALHWRRSRPHGTSSASASPTCSCPCSSSMGPTTRRHRGRQPRMGAAAARPPGRGVRRRAPRRAQRGRPPRGRRGDRALRAAGVGRRPHRRRQTGGGHRPLMLGQLLHRWAIAKEGV